MHDAGIIIGLSIVGVGYLLTSDDVQVNRLVFQSSNFSFFFFFFFFFHTRSQTLTHTQIAQQMIELEQCKETVETETALRHSLEEQLLDAAADQRKQQIIGHHGG